MSCCCPPTCVIPTCVPACSPPVCYPVGGLGSLTSCGLGSGGGSASAASLGLAHGASVSCVNQTPPSEIVVQPPPFNIVVPGAVLAASCEPIRVGGYTACGGGSSGGSSRLRYFPCSPCSPCK
uniref:Beta-keratin n=1 Tax=Pantherophis guttatus TaxID=94885 RepID=D4HTZ9_PANGU|nr:beta-keratin [Pantherophis guttatus]